MKYIILLLGVMMSTLSFSQTMIYYDDGTVYTVPESTAIYVSEGPLWTKTQSEDNIEFGKVTENSKRDGDDDPPPPSKPYCFGPLKPAASTYDCDLNGDVIGQDPRETQKHQPKHDGLEPNRVVVALLIGGAVLDGITGLLSHAQESTGQPLRSALPCLRHRAALVGCAR